MTTLTRLSLVLGLLLVFAGCSDSIVSTDTDRDMLVDRRFDTETASKARHGDLFNRALRADETAGKDDNGRHLGLIMKVNKSAVLERYKVMERYKLMERYKVLERYEYNEVIGGFAITVEDTEGLEDYNAFLEELDNDPDISWYEPDFDVDMPEMTVGSAPSGQIIPWSVAAIGGTDSWTVSGNGSGMVGADVYVLDTGVAKAWSSDPDDDLWLRENVDFTDTLEPDASDHDGHGTHVAGIVGAIDDYDNVVGVAPGVAMHNFKVLGDDGTSDVSVVIAAVEELTRRKNADPATPIVVNLSLGENLGTEAHTALDDAIDQSIKTGVHYVIAAGNDGARAKHVTPAKVQGALTVGSYDVNGLYSTFSNWGQSVDILAPGENIISLSKDGTSSVTMSGTSMAAAHVTGAVALYVAQHPSATPAEVKDYILSTARSFVVGAPSATTNLSVWVGPAEAPAADPEPDPQTDPAAELEAASQAFLQYALFSQEKIEIKKGSVIGQSGSSANSDSHTNGELKIADKSVRGYGFGTFSDKNSGDEAGIFNPVSNPQNLSALRSAPAVDFSLFDADQFAAQATEWHDGDLKPVSSITLGTEDNPVFIYVDGKVKFETPITIHGYGAIFANDNVDFKANVLSTDGQVGIFTTKDIAMDDEVVVHAALVAGGTLETGKASTVYGSAASFKLLRVQDLTTLHYRPLLGRIADLFW